MDSYRRCVFVYFFASFLTLLSYRAMPADLLEEAPNVTCVSRTNPCGRYGTAPVLGNVLPEPKSL